MKRLCATSLSRSLPGLLAGGSVPGQVLAVFDRACNLMWPDGGVAALVFPEIGDGPLNIVVNASSKEWGTLDMGQAVHCAEQKIQLGVLEVDLSQAKLWQPRPDWEELRSRRAVRLRRLPELRGFVAAHAPRESLMALRSIQDTEANPPAEAPFQDEFLLTAQKAATVLRSAWPADTSRLQASAAQLAGLGTGLTPAGDDFLCGVFLWAWLAHPTPRRICGILLDGVLPRTTVLSAALLRAAASGECSAPWHRLLAGLHRGAASETESAALEVLSHGSTSGGDTLAGFLWMSS